MRGANQFRAGLKRIIYLHQAVESRSAHVLYALKTSISTAPDGKMKSFNYAAVEYAL